MGFIGQHARFCCTHAKAKITEFGDQQASKISVRTKLLRQMYSGDQLGALETLDKMQGSLKGSLKFSLEHSLELRSPKLVWKDKEKEDPLWKT